MKKAMISQPMLGRTDEEILATRAKAKAALEAKGFEVVDTFFQEQWAEAATRENAQ